MAIREAESVKFATTPAVSMALFSGRLGSRGLTLLHFREVSDLDALEQGSTNANFIKAFRPFAQLPSASNRWEPYDDIPHAIHGLATFGNELWYDHVRKLTSRLSTFVCPAFRPFRRLACGSRYLLQTSCTVRPWGCLQSDTPHW
ncbi:hypothetical protein PHMEG_00022156 [Phytophthora megakarya]|uniref:Uncharacterized protein n=1 Tax=Phytophthora megakarya TaxID=4795 RepID=A0A225VJX0_9STRA|nr:hypothetical protein PHMEG_00022156 [Phytophthora megakarya]